VSGRLAAKVAVVAGAGSIACEGVRHRRFGCELTRSVAMQHAQHGVRANAVVPGLMATPRITLGRRWRD
jgi:NAD(P)-dependent dehydrogenase (short-subunit alcohol dehydrogenase family)